jgi:hypothetical protein
VDPIVRVGLSGVEAAAPESKLRAVRARLSRRHAVRLPAILDEKLLAVLRNKIDGAAFRDLKNEGERRGTLVDPSLNALLTVLFSDQRFFRVIESLSGCARIERLTGNVYRMEPGPRHFLDWHGDLRESTRVMTMTVNLGREPVRGGKFQIKRLGQKRLLAEFPYDRGGDAILFRLAPRLRHRSTRVTGTAAKTIFSCWFHAAASHAPGRPTSARWVAKGRPEKSR